MRESIGTWVAFVAVVLPQFACSPSQTECHAPQYRDELGRCVIDCHDIPNAHCDPDSGAVIEYLDAAAETGDVANDASPTCDSGLVCNGRCTSEADPNNCGRCGNACVGGAHAMATCNAGVCALACAPGFADCDGDATTGCESDLHTAMHCGLCTTTCSGSTPVCSATSDAGSAGYACSSGCGGSTPTRCGNACSDLQSDPLNCGACYNVCVAVGGATMTCTAGQCGFECLPGYERVGIDCSMRVPRQIRPLSTSNVTSQTPTLRWELPTDVDGATVEICPDQSFNSTQCQTIDATGTSARPTRPLTRGPWFWRVRGRIGSTPGARTSPIWEIFVGAHSAGDASWISALDSDRDGTADVVVGDVDGPSSTKGRVYVYRGARTGLRTTPQTLAGFEDNSQFGVSVAPAGDVNGDGFGDLIVGADYADGVHAGFAYLFLGNTGGIALSPAAALTINAAGALFGHAVASAGDVNGDGYGDVIVGSPTETADGRARVYFGGADGLQGNAAAVLHGTAAAEGFGDAFASIGDIDGDGRDDLIVGAPGANASAGRVYLIRGATDGAALGVSDTLEDPDGTPSYLGISLGNAGDVDGDGSLEFVAGARRYSSSAGVAFVFGTAAGAFNHTVYTRLPNPGVTSTANFGAAAAGGGDVDGDGYADVLVGAHGANRAYLFTGSALGLSPTRYVTLSDGTPSGTFGIAVSIVGDVQADGFGDVVVGNRMASSASYFAGSAAGVPTAPTVMLDGMGGDSFGISVARRATRAVRPRRSAVLSLPLAAIHPSL